MRCRCTIHRFALANALAVPLVVAGADPVLAKPMKSLGAPRLVLDGKQPINVEIGHAAPAVMDFNRDGKKDLLVGQFGGGRLRIYLNKGSKRNPQFQGFQYLTIGGKQVTVPYG